MKTITEMAREANAMHNTIEEWVTFDYAELERFAELVRADERADLYKEIHDPLVLMCKQLVADEREACAKVCEDEICNCCWDEQAGAVAEHLAETIRARGNT